MSQDIKKSVERYYAKAIQVASDGCCSPKTRGGTVDALGKGLIKTGAAADSCCSSDANPLSAYPSQLVAKLPKEMTGASFGCGNPFAISALKPGQRVLDLGSGAGLDCIMAAHQVGEQGRVYGLDMTDEMLAVAAKNFAAAGLRNAILLKGDIEAIPLPNRSVDVIISNCVINLAPNKERVFAEAYRVLDAGGVLQFSDIVVDGKLAGFSMGEDQIRSALSWSGCIGGALEKGQFEAMLRAAGFDEVSIEFTQYFTPQDMGNELPQELAKLAQEEQNAIAARFGSAQIRASKR